MQGFVRGRFGCQSASKISTNQRPIGSIFCHVMWTAYVSSRTYVPKMECLQKRSSQYTVFLASSFRGQREKYEAAYQKYRSQC